MQQQEGGESQICLRPTISLVIPRVSGGLLNEPGPEFPLFNLPYSPTIAFLPPYELRASFVTPSCVSGDWTSMTSHHLLTKRKVSAQWCPDLMTGVLTLTYKGTTIGGWCSWSRYHFYDRSYAIHYSALFSYLAHQPSLGLTGFITF